MYHPSMALVEVDSVSKSYPRSIGLRREDHFAVCDVSFHIARGETLGLVGESGSGKSTLARMVLGLVPLTSGSIRVGGIEVKHGAGDSRMHSLRRRMQPVFQDPAAALNPRMPILEIVTEPLRIHRKEAGIDTSRAALLRAARELMRSVGLDDSALTRYPHEFSGGQKQRINIARALALKPEFVVLDEPVSALDVSVGAQIVNLLQTLQREHGLTYLFISHAMPLVRYLSTRIAVLQKGCMIETGEAEQLCASPSQVYTRELISATPELPQRS